MNPELIERPHEIAYYRSLHKQEQDRRIELARPLFWMGIGFVLCLFWRWIYGLIF